MGRDLRINAAGVQAMATRWYSSGSDLREMVAPAEMGLSYQSSAAAVSAAHADISAFKDGLAARVDYHAAGVARADTSYLSQGVTSTATVAGIYQPLISE